MSTKESLRDIFTRAELAMAKDDSLGTLEMVGFFNEIKCMLLKGDVEIQELEEAFIEDFDSTHECPWELTQLSMYHLRLPKFRKFLEEKLKLATEHDGWRAIPVISSILGAYKDPWAEKDLFYENN